MRDGDEVEAALRAWLETRALPATAVAPLAGDVSPRRYFRVRLASGADAVAAFYPPAARPACARFLRSGGLLAAAGVRVPAVRVADCDSGWMLLEDLGPTSLYESPRGWDLVGVHLRAAVDVLGRLRTLPAAAVAELNPPLDAELLGRELEQTFAAWLLPRGLAGDAALAAELRALLAAFCGELGAAAPVPCHRDFMARNLVPVDGDLAVLDHQDLRLGPPGYDLASLLNDSLFPPAALAEELRRRAGVGERAYRLAAVQRTLKAVGTFAVFAARGAPRHLPLVRPTLGRCLEHLRALPEGAALAARLAPLWAEPIC